MPPAPLPVADLPDDTDMPPAPDPEAAPTEQAPAGPVSGVMSDKVLAENDWGGSSPTATVHFHDDGPVGTAIKFMGPDRHMDVDGEPLANVLGTVATDVVRGRRSAQQAVDELTTLRDRLPEASKARFCLTRAIDQMDAPASPAPAVPDSTPEPLRELVRALHAVPIVRADPSRELAPLLTIIGDLATGRAKPALASQDIRGLRNKRHESYGDCGKFEIDRAIDTAITALRDQQQPPRKET
jgi:hypothetical protein